MQFGRLNVNPMEKIISIISYFTMGMVGFIWIIIAYFLNKRIKFFLMYNITQSIIISILLAILSLLINIFLQIIMVIPFLNTLGLYMSMFLQRRIAFFGLSFNVIETIVFLLLIYISAGILVGKNVYIPVLTNIMNKVMQSYR